MALNTCLWGAVPLPWRVLTQTPPPPPRPQPCSGLLFQALCWDPHLAPPILLFSLEMVQVGTGPGRLGLSVGECGWIIGRNERDMGRLSPAGRAGRASVTSLAKQWWGEQDWVLGQPDRCCGKARLGGMGTGALGFRRCQKGNEGAHNGGDDSPKTAQSATLQTQVVNTLHSPPTRTISWNCFWNHSEI